MIAVALAAPSATAWAQLTRTEKVSIGKITDFYRGGVIEFIVETPRNSDNDKSKSGEKALTIRVTASTNQFQTGSGKFNSKDVATVIKNLEQMLSESEKTPDELMYTSVEKSLVVSLVGGEKPVFGLTLDDATTATIGQTEEYNRQVLKTLIELLKKGQSVLDSQ
jgi:hypothetical protein